MNYTEAAAALNGRESKKIGNNTYMKRREGGAVACMLHDTDVITWKPDGGIIYNSGGWKTVTTKARMNEYGPASVCQTAGQWYIDGKAYADGCIYKDGQLTGCADIVADKALRKEARAINKYTRDYIEAFRAGKVPAPGGGDCWGCCMVAEDGTRPLGRDGQHMRDHMAEPYFVPSIIVRAVERFPVSIAAKAYIGEVWHGGNKGLYRIEGICLEQLTRSIRRWVRCELGGAA